MYKYLTHDVSIIEICQQERSKISHNYVKKSHVSISIYSLKIIYISNSKRIIFSMLIIIRLLKLQNVINTSINSFLIFGNFLIIRNQKKNC